MIATISPSTDGIIRPQIPRRAAMRLAATEYDRMADATGRSGTRRLVPTDGLQGRGTCASWRVT